MMVLGLSSILLLGIAAVMQLASKNSMENQSQASLLSAVNSLRISLSRTKSANVGSSCDCMTVFGLDAAFDPSSGGKTPVHANIDGLVYKTGTVIPQANLSVTEFYLTDATALGAAAGGKTNYLTDLYLTGRSSSLFKTPRKVATMTVQIDSTSAMTSCNLYLSSTDANTACNNTFGMHWNSTLHQCQEAMADDGASTNFQCPPGLRPSPSDPTKCKPIPSTCASGQLATSFSMGLVTNCSDAPVTAPHLAARVPASADYLTVPEGAAAPPPAAPPVSQPTFVAPAVVQTTNTPASAPAPDSCSDGTAVSPLSAAPCIDLSMFTLISISGPSCMGSWTIPPTIATSCQTQAATTYKTPDLTTVVPDPPAPADNSCQCNTRRIADGDYCMFCVRDVDLGYGYADFSYGVSQCHAGNLTDVPNPGLASPVSSCNNSYGRARYTGSGYRQYDEP